VRALRLSEGNLLVLFSSTVGNVLWSFLVLSLVLPVLRPYLRRKVSANSSGG
jgi:putative tricarboxylic transport membrane protein